MKKVFIASACRTAIGGFGGSLQKITPAELGKTTASEALTRAGIPEGEKRRGIDEVIIGNVLGAGHGMNIARQITLKSGLPVTTPAYTVNKVCGSGLKAVTLGASEIAMGSAEAILAGGAESMSQAVYVAKDARWGGRLGNMELKDLILEDGLSDVFNSCHMGITAENLASRFEISRKEQDEFALESQRRAGKAQKEGLFAQEIVPVSIPKKGGAFDLFQVDEHARPDTKLENLAGLKPAFKKDGTVTAGNASGINDGAAMMLLVSEEKLKGLGAKPLVEIIGWASSGVDPAVMGIGPVEAVKSLCKKTGVDLKSVDWIEANEAFAAQSLAVTRELGWDLNKVNPLGGAIALGHPIGASGARILVTLIHQLKRTGKELGIATLCVGGGQGIAVMVRNC